MLPTRTTLELDPGPLLVFGGPYSNLHATKAMRAKAHDLGVSPERTICTGDVVAYGADPEATVAVVREWGCHVIAGNCEEQLAAGAQDCGCGFEEGSHCDLLAKGWYPYADARVSADSRSWMSGLPSTLRVRIGARTLRVVHGSATNVSEFLFASEAGRLDAALAGTEEDTVLAGHSGLPFGHVKAGDGRLWLNAGVIGMPANDGTRETWYMLLDITRGDVSATWHRLAYDHQAAAAAMRRAGHANAYARTLITGLWPSLDILPSPERAATGVALTPPAIRMAVTPSAFMAG